MRLAVGVGSRLLSYPIDDLGRIRFRYPIFPVHSEGHTVSMELEVSSHGPESLSTRRDTLSAWN